MDSISKKMERASVEERLGGMEKSGKAEKGTKSHIISQRPMKSIKQSFVWLAPSWLNIN